jgi:branched-chain amino acid transport system substrate-binding protein
MDDKNQQTPSASGANSGMPQDVKPSVSSPVSTPSPSPTFSPTSSSSTESGTPPSTVGGLGGSNKNLLRVVALVVVVVLIGGVVAFMLTNKSDKNTPTNTNSTAKVKIGVLLATSGGSSSMGYGALKGIQLAKKQLNAENIELVQADGMCDPKTAPTAMQYLIDQKVVAVIGENCSSASKAVLELANANKIPMLSPSASSPTLSIENDYFFRTVPSDIGQGTFLAQSMYNQGLRKVAVFYTNEPYGSAIKDVFKEKFEALGGKVAVAVTAESSVIDVKTQVDAIKASAPDGIAIVTNSTVSSTAVMKLARQQGMTVPLYGGDNLYDNTIITNNGTAAEGLKVVSFPTGTKAFKQDLLNEYHVTEQLYAAPEAYDAFATIYKAVQKGATTGEKFKQIIPTIEFEGASAHIKFDKYGEIPYQTYKYDLLQVKDGAFVLVTQ